MKGILLVKEPDGCVLLGEAHGNDVQIMVDSFKSFCAVTETTWAKLYSNEGGDLLAEFTTGSEFVDHTGVVPKHEILATTH